MNKAKARRMKKSKLRKSMRQSTFDPTVESKYSQKKVRQAKGDYSSGSPFHVTYMN